MSNTKWKITYILVMFTISMTYAWHIAYRIDEANIAKHWVVKYAQAYWECRKELNEALFSKTKR